MSTRSLEARQAELAEERRRRHVAVAELERRNALKRIDANMQPVEALAAYDAEFVDEDSSDDDDEDGLAGHRAAAKGKVAFFRTCDDRCLSRADESGRTALFYACAHDRPDCVLQLLKRGAPVQADANGDTPENMPSTFRSTRRETIQRLTVRLKITCKIYFRGFFTNVR